MEAIIKQLQERAKRFLTEAAHHERQSQKLRIQAEAFNEAADLATRNVALGLHQASTEMQETLRGSGIGGPANVLMADKDAFRPVR